MNTDNNIPRRNNLQLLTKPEKSIKQAIADVEAIGASESLTMAITKLTDAFNIVADVFDNDVNAEKFNFKCAQLSITEEIDEKWTEPKNDSISVPDALYPLFNKIGFQLRFHTISGKNEILTMAHITEIARQFFKQHPETLGK